MSFRPVRSQPVPDLGLHAHEFVHPCGLRHIHLASSDPESAFAFAFPTTNATHDGRAHVLEHLVLCGSQKFDVRSPFMAMTQRSLASFMNAMTYADRTLYPFSTADRQDFFNLLDVYLDITFFPLLRKRDFLQEGWRLGFDDRGQPQLAGVVFNEMKGALAGRTRWAYHHAMAVLVPGSPAAVVSGGDPTAIPDLTYETLVDFHRAHYHPARAVMLSYGAIDPRVIQDRVLQGLGDLVNQAAPAIVEMPTQAPAVAFATVPVWADEGDTDHSCVMGWQLGDSFAGDQSLTATFMAHVLVGSDHAPLRRVLSEQPFGRPSDLTFLSNDSSDMVLLVGMDGLEPSQVATAQALITTEIERLANEGVPMDVLQAAFRELQLQARADASGFSNGVNCLVEIAPRVLVGADALATLDPERLDALADTVLHPQAVADWVRKHLVDNPRRVVIDFVPHPEAAADQAKALEQRLAALVAAAGEPGLAQARADETALVAAQADKDVSALPCLDLSQVDRAPRAMLAHQATAGNADAVLHVHVPATTRGIASVALTLDLSALTPSDQEWADLALGLLPSLGQGEMDWAQTSAWRAQRCQGFDSDTGAFVSRAWPDRVGVRGQIQARSLDSCAADMVPALVNAFTEAKFNETERLRFLLEEEQAGLRTSLASLGHRLAAIESRAQLHLLGEWEQRKQGRGKLTRIDRLVEKLQRDPAGLVEELERIHAVLLTVPRMVQSWGSDAARTAGAALAKQVAGPSFQSPDQCRGVNEKAGTEQAGPRILLGPTSVQFCHQAWAAAPAHHEDAPLMELLAEAVGHGFLHQAIREQGSAYGGSASYRNGVFSMFSYRDPRLTDTFSDFARGLDWACTHRLDDQAVLESKLATMQRLGAPMTGNQLAQATLASLMVGVTWDQRAQFRERLLDATAEDLREAANRWLPGAATAQVAFAGQGAVDREKQALDGWTQAAVWPVPAKAAAKPGR